VVLTGGPCAGKSTLLSMIQTKFAQRAGIKVYCVPEAATLLVAGGLEWTEMTEEKIIEYQLALLRVQLVLEDQLCAIAKANNQPSLIVSDRGSMDGRAYCSPEQFAEVLRRGGWDMETLRDERYDAVVHMVSAAIGATEFYNFDNPARFENVSEAAIADEKLRQMYVGHPLLRVFDNTTGFENKLERVMQFIGHVIGHECPHNTTRRYVLKKAPLESDITMPFVRARVTLTVLNNSTEDEVMQVMKREQDNSCIYFYTCIKRRKPNAECSEGAAASTAGDDTSEGGAQADSSTTLDCTMLGAENVTKSEHRISAREYASLVHQRDPTRVDVVKDNISFVFQSHYCEVATFVAPQWTIGRSTLYVDCDDSSAALELPCFLEIDHERRSGWGSSFQISHESRASFHGSSSPTR
jgi:predicted ATPase